jgi:hypothetical protein
MPGVIENSDYSLTEEQKAHFLEHGYVKIPGCFTREQASEFTAKMWTRLGMDPNDKSTWTTEKTNMPWHHHVPVAEFSPKAWSAMCQLLGGEDRISDKMEYRVGVEGDIHFLFGLPHGFPQDDATSRNFL